LGKTIVGHEIGVETIKEFALPTASIKEIGQQAVEKSVGMEMGIGETFVGISKSFLLQSIISAVLASGMTDRWLVEPHFESQKL
jgi:hypothetical protein